MNPISITVQHPATLSASDILGIISGIVTTDAPVVISALPVSGASQGKIAVYTALGELGLGIIQQIAAQIAAAHAAKVAA